MNDYSWAQDPLSEALLTEELIRALAPQGPGVPTSPGLETEDLLFGDDAGPSPEWAALRDTAQDSLLETRCALEFIAYNTHSQPTVQVCRYPWYHDGAHGTRIPELYAEWDRLAIEIGAWHERKRA